MAIAGKVAITSGGEWSASVAYDKLVVVTYNNDLYLSKKSNTGVTPTDTENWQLLIKNVTQEQYESILNGTTAVGNALKVNGHTIMTNAQLTTPINECASYTDLFSQIPENGTFIGYTWYAPSWFPNVADSNWHVIVDKFSNASIEIRVFSTANVGLDYKATYAYGTTWSGWKHIGDGGNADTVGGYHASELVRKFQGWGREFFGSANINTWVSDGVYAYQGGDTNQPHGDWGTIQVLAPLKSDRVTQIGYDWNEAYQPYRARYSNDGGANWSEWDYLNSSVLANFLPIDGSVPMSGTNLLIGSGYGRWHSDNNSCTIGALNAPNNTNNMRSVDIFSPSFRTDIAKALQFRDTVNGAYKYYDIHHDGNSAKVAIKSTAPTDTSAVWVDSANKVSKIYIDGAWTALA